MTAADLARIRHLAFTAPKRNVATHKCPACQEVSNVRVDVMARVLHCHTCGKITPLPRRF